MPYDKEKVYAEQIASKMTEIIKICQDNGINMLASFYLAEETNAREDCTCTTYLPGEKESENLHKSKFVVLGKADIIPNTIAFTIKR